MLEDGKLVGKVSELFTPARHGESGIQPHRRHARQSLSGILLLPLLGWIPADFGALPIG
jgi:hypothetical protein